MDVIIPAAGVGKRLRPLTLTRPKVLIPVAGKPILGHILDRVIDFEVAEITVVVGYLGEQIVEYVEKNYPTKKFRFIEQKERKGLGHAVGLALKDVDDPVLIILGDTIIDTDYGVLFGSEKNVIGVMPVDDPRRFGVVEVKDGHVKRLVEKPEVPPSNLAIAGIYLIQSQRMLKSAIKEIIKRGIKTRDEYQLTDALQLLLEKGIDMEISEIGACYDCGTRKTLLDTNQKLLKQRRQEKYNFESSVIIPPVFIHPEAKIKKSIIGPYVSIGRNTAVEYSIVENSIIDSGSLIKNTVVKKSLIGYNSYIKGSAFVLDMGDYSSKELT